MSENNESKENQKRQFDEEQYKMLLRCSEKKDMTEWNEWRKANEKTPILLEGANLRGAHLEGAISCGAHLEGAKLMRKPIWKALIFRKPIWKALILGEPIWKALILWSPS